VAVMKAQHQELSLLQMQEIDTMIKLNEWFDFLDDSGTTCKQKDGEFEEGH